jgi:hypothetical protein
MSTTPLIDLLIHNTRSLLAFFLFIMVSKSYTIAQENPWAARKGNNPWGTTEENKQEKKLYISDSTIVLLNSDSLKAQTPALPVKEAEVIQVDREMDMIYIAKYKSYFYKVSKTNFYAYSSTEITDTIFLSADDGKILILDRKHTKTLENLDSYAMAQHKAPGAFIGSFISSAVLNIFSIPINLISLAFPSYGKDRFVTNYIMNNKSAKAVEIKNIKKGIWKKKAMNTGMGTLLGIASSTFFWVLIIN